MLQTRPKASVVGTVAVMLSSAVLMLSACGSAPEPAPEPREQPDAQTIQDATSMAQAVRPAVSINALMVSSIDHAAHVLWDAAAEPPASDLEWLELEYHAIQLAAMGTMISLGGTGPADPGWARLPSWAGYSQQMADVGTVALDAARGMNTEAISAAGDNLVEICETCHMEFKPDSPTEGLTHTPHYPR